MSLSIIIVIFFEISIFGNNQPFRFGSVIIIYMETADCIQMVTTSSPPPGRRQKLKVDERDDYNNNQSTTYTFVVGEGWDDGM